jgi:uncharacterized membrane protein
VPVEHVWFFVRTRVQLEKVMTIVEALPGLVIFTLVCPSSASSCRSAAVPAACPACPCWMP